MPQEIQTRVETYPTQKALGAILIALGLIGLIGWVGSIEPDCYYSTKVGLQIRLCGENYIGRDEPAHLWVPAMFFAVLSGGVVLRVRARKSGAAPRVTDAD